MNDLMLREYYSKLFSVGDKIFFDDTCKNEDNFSYIGTKGQIFYVSNSKNREESLGVQGEEQLQTPV